MEREATAIMTEGTDALHQWAARRVQPIVLLYVVAVFGVMMLIAHFAVHSTQAVKALALAAIGSIIPLVPAVASRVEYRLTAHALERRPLDRKRPQPFTKVFDIDQLSRVEPRAHGFAFHKSVGESSAVRRFYRTHLSGSWSGEVHAGTGDRDRVLGILDQLGVPRR